MFGKLYLRIITRVIIGAWLALVVAAPALGQERVNLALGRPVQFAPLPDTPEAPRQADAATLLTDGKLVGLDNGLLWYRPEAVAYAYPGVVLWSCDLGRESNVGEVAVRFQGGSPYPGWCFPCWIDLLASDDGQRYYRVASYSRFTAGDAEKYAVPRDEGKAWIHNLRFRDANVRARHVGLAFYASAYSASDEMAVYEGPAGGRYRRAAEGTPTAFTLAGPTMYFHKIVIQAPINIDAPTPVGVILPPGRRAMRATAVLDLPEGIRLTGGHLGGTRAAMAETETLAGGATTRHTFECDVAGTERGWSRLYLRASWPEGRQGVARYQLRWRGGASPVLEQPILAVRIPPAPPPKRLMTTLSWWALGDTIGWPGAREAFHILGLNTLPLFGHLADLDGAMALETIGKFRAAGFKVLNVDSTFHIMMAEAGPRRDELTCRFADGTHGERLCPSYRGTLYQEELARLERECLKAKADALACDIELWRSGGPTDPPRCIRCQADFQRSGAKDWRAWRLMKGEEMWRDLATRVRMAVPPQRPPDMDLGMFELRAGENYLDFWPFDRLYPKYLTNSEPAYYTPLCPYHLALIGDAVRTDRARLPRSDVLPWLTPGDAGPLPGEAFTAAILECYANGARGTHFWSGRLWDTETLAALARAIRIVAPVEDVIVDGDLVRDVRTDPPVRVSGMRRGDESFLLIADYESRQARAVDVQLPIAKTCTVVDLTSGKQIARLAAGAKRFRVTLGAGQAVPLHVVPVPTKEGSP